MIIIFEEPNLHLKLSYSSFLIIASVDITSSLCEWVWEGFDHGDADADEGGYFMVNFSNDDFGIDVLVGV